MTDREHSERVSLRINPRALQQIEALAALRGVSVSACVRSMLDHFLADDGGKAAELARIRNVFGGSHRRRRT